MLREQEGEAGFALVEEYRARTKALRAADPRPAGDFGPEGAALLARTDALCASTQARLVVRAFTAYFHLVNMAEEHHRLRVLRQRDGAAAATPRAASRSRRRSPRRRARRRAARTRVRALLDGLRVEPVFTAHPTEARRRTVLDKLRRLAASPRAWTSRA